MFCPDPSRPGPQRAHAAADMAVAQMRKDKKEAVRIGRLKAKAAARGAAPPPPGKGGAPAPAINYSGAEPTVAKYRAVEDFDGEVTFEKGATLFCLGDPVDGKIMAVVNGESGNVPMSALVEITDELLAKERAEREAAAEARRAELEAQAESADVDDAAVEAAVAAAPTQAGESEADKKARILSEEKSKAHDAAMAAAKAEEDKMKAEAARLEELMRQLDMSDDEDD